jgi:hypothetical protein
MNNTKLLKIAVVLLLILNICTISMIVFHGGKQGGPKDEIIEKLKFDDKQIVSYELLIEQHKLSVKSNREQIKDTKDKLFALLKGDDYSEKEILIGNLEKLNTEIEHLNFNHFVDIKNICELNQIEDFNKLTQELGHLFSKGKKHGK